MNCLWINKDYLSISIYMYLATVNKMDETETLFLQKCLILPLSFLRLTNFKTSHGNIHVGGYLSFSLYAATLRLHVPCLGCKQ